MKHFFAAVLLTLCLSSQSAAAAWPEAASKYLSTLNTLAEYDTLGIIKPKHPAIQDLQNTLQQAAELAKNNREDEASLLLQHNIQEQTAAILGGSFYRAAQKVAALYKSSGLDCEFLATTSLQLMIVGAFFGGFAISMYGISYALGVLFMIPMLVLGGAGLLLSPIALICIPFIL